MKTLPELFDKALSMSGTHTRQDIAEGVKRGQFSYFGNDRACIVTEFVDYPRDRKLNIFIGAGDYETLVNELLPKAVSFAKDNGCSSVTMIARKGFLRRNTGFRPKRIEFEMEV